MTLCADCEHPVHGNGICDTCRSRMLVNEGAYNIGCAGPPSKIVPYIPSDDPGHQYTNHQFPKGHSMRNASPEALAEYNKYDLKNKGDARGPAHNIMEAHYDEVEADHDKMFPPYELPKIVTVQIGPDVTSACCVNALNQEKFNRDKRGVVAFVGDTFICPSCKKDYVLEDYIKDSRMGSIFQWRVPLYNPDNIPVIVAHGPANLEDGEKFAEVVRNYRNSSAVILPSDAQIHYRGHPVTQTWTHLLPLMQQALLLTAVRGPDGMGKFNQAKEVVLYLRGVVLNPAHPEKVANGTDSFMYARRSDYEEGTLYLNEEHTESTGCMSKFYTAYILLLKDHDGYPHHFLMHLIHAAEVIGYKHYDPLIRESWTDFYFEACKAFHMTPETEAEMDARLNA